MDRAGRARSVSRRSGRLLAGAGVRAASLPCAPPACSVALNLWMPSTMGATRPAPSTPPAWKPCKRWSAGAARLVPTVLTLHASELQLPAQPTQPDLDANVPRHPEVVHGGAVLGGVKVLGRHAGWRLGRGRQLQEGEGSISGSGGTGRWGALSVSLGTTPALLSRLLPALLKKLCFACKRSSGRAQGGLVSRSAHLSRSAGPGELQRRGRALRSKSRSGLREIGREGSLRYQLRPPHVKAAASHYG